MSNPQYHADRARSYARKATIWAAIAVAFAVLSIVLTLLGS